MKTTARFIPVILAMMILSVWGARRAHAWGAHIVVSEGFGAGAGGLTSDIPDTWGESHFGRQYLAEKVKYWTAKAKPLPASDSNKQIYMGYALHYLEDAGQPWHVYRGGNITDGVGDGPDTPHIKFEYYAAGRYALYAGAISEGARSPVAITSDSDAYDKTIKLAEAVNDLYPYMDAEKKWDGNSKQIEKALRYVGQYGRGLVNYIMAPPEAAVCKPGMASCHAAANRPVKANPVQTGMVAVKTGASAIKMGVDAVVKPAVVGFIGSLDNRGTGELIDNEAPVALPQPAVAPEKPKKTGFFGGLKDFFRKWKWGR